MYLIYDTETTGLPKDFKAPVSDSDNWPRCVQLAWQLHDADGSLISHQNYIIKPEGYTIPYNAEKIHGISTQRAIDEGHDLQWVLDEFEKDVAKTSWVIGHNIEFDINIMGAEYYRKNTNTVLFDKEVVDTKDKGTDFCQIPGGRGGKFKWPTLTELYKKLFGVGFDDAHDAAYDVEATTKCFFGLVSEGVIEPIDKRDPNDVNYQAPVLAEANFKVADKKKKVASDVLKEAKNADISTLLDVDYTHLHCHTQFSILQATTDVNALVATAKKLEMKAIAMVDHGNMMGAFHFVKAALKEGIIPIVGCEYNVCQDHKDKSKKQDGFQQVLLAKNKAGYHNLAKLASCAFVDGFYYVPRIDKELILQYKGDIIVTTGGLWGEIPSLILNVGEQQAEEAFVWWKEQFGDDFYVELNRHGVEEEQIVNDILLKFAKKYDVKYIAANNTYYTTAKDASAHDILLCVKDGEKITKPKRYLGKKGREFRYGFPNDEFYIKSGDEMKRLFADLPESIITTNEIVDKIETFKLERDVLLPKFDIPEEFQDPKDDDDPSLKIGENNFLRHLTYVGAEKRYEEITDEIRERLDFELSVIQNTGYPGYFLIVQDFTSKSREMGVSVGPGRGSAAGSAVAYCIGITNVDPIKYDLLFERFLNPDRVSLPDIDIDFDDEGRQKVIDYVIEKYGASQVAQIITYGTMAAKSAIRDTARALDLPLSEADMLAKLVPDIKLKKLFSLNDQELADKLKNNPEAIQMANELKRVAAGSDESARVVNQARILEGSVRNTGIHACGVIITPDDITKFVPVALAKDSDMYCTQFDNSVVENAGLLKMDFLGLKTLTLIKDAVRNVKDRHDVELVPDDFPIDDVPTYELFQRGETVGIFQYESAGMQKYMRELKPTTFADLIAMNALYRPGPLEYIPSFIRRKHGDEEIVYDIEDCKEYLEETYGITVYQEQVMLLSQSLAGFTKGEADVLRKAMGKKIFALLEELKPKFVGQGVERGHNKKSLEKIWKDWEAFAAYAFNKSHSTCYAWVAYQTAYLKANYPAEYMASVLSNNMNDIKQVTFFMEECRRMGMDVLGPDVNESGIKFKVNSEGAVRFGLAAIKGSGDAAVHAIIEERNEGGPFKDIFDFASRVNLRQVNKKTFEVLAMSGAFDCFSDYHRKQYLADVEGEGTLIEKVIRFANKKAADEQSSQASLFGGESGVELAAPKVANCEPYGEIEKLNIEKEVVGLYITGHPLDQFKLEINAFCTCTLDKVEEFKNQNINVAGIVTKAQERLSKTGKPFGLFTIEDYNSSRDLAIFGEEYLKNRHFINIGGFLYLKGKVEERYNSPGEWQFRPFTIELLSDIRDKMCKGVSVTIDLAQLSEQLLEELITIVESHLGSSILKVQVYDRDENVAVDTLSRKIKVNPSNELIESLTRIAGIECKVLS